ncbi:MAG: hypothetical protein M3R21_02015 [Candidatus Dormibacteraeota bacterium]|nr:hypothetical protein [Candidatus Dormibacteraeota bacterium]
MTKVRFFGLLAMLAVIASACTRPSSSGTSAKPLDFYGANPTLADVRSLLGDSNWWPGPPSFGVRPLDSASMPYREKFHVITRFTHIGTAETFDIEYTLWDSTSSATTQMTNIHAAFGTSANGSKVGDQVLYYGSQISGAAPYGTATFVRVGQIITTITLNLKDGFPSVSQLGRIASKVTSRLKDVLAGKVHVTPLSATDAVLLPPAGPDLTLLGSVKLPIEAVIVMFGFAAPEAIAGALHITGVDTIVFGDYALNNDTHMEVRAGVFNFNTTTDAATWFNAIRGTYNVDSSGIATFYDYSSGQYFSLFTAGTKGALLVCRSTASQESASRACEQPLARVAPSWQVNLTP